MKSYINQQSLKSFMNKKVLLVDASINFILGILLLSFSKPVTDFLGVPYSEVYFYPNILGAVLIGIAIALVMEYSRKPDGLIGLGLGGAIAINLCAGFVLALWLIFGNLNLPLKGKLFLWLLVIILVGISSVELIVHKKQ